MSIQPYNYDDPTQNTTNSTGGSFVNIKPFSYTPTPAPQPSFLSKVGSFFSPVVNGAKSLISDLSNVYNAPPPAETTISPESYLGGVQDWGKNVIDAWSNLGDSIIHPAVMPNTSFGVNAGVDLATSGLKAVQAFFTPLSDLFNKAAAIPGPIGDVANGVNQTFNAIAVGAGDTAEGLVQDIPYISQDTKTAITPVIKQIAGLAGQIAAGKAIDDTYQDIKTKSVDVLNKISEDARIKTLNDNTAIKQNVQNQHPLGEKVPIQSDNTETNIPIKNPEKVNIPVRSESVATNIEPYRYTPDEKLPTIQMGNKPTETLPTIQTEPADVNTLPKGMRYEPITEPSTTNSTGQETTPIPTIGKTIPSEIQSKTTEPSVDNQIQPKNAPQQTITPKVELPTETIKSPVNEAETPKPTTGKKVSGVANSIESKAVEAKLTQGYSEKAGYESSTFKEQADRVVDLINNNPDDARAIVRGEKPMPEGMKSAPLIAGMEEYAKLNPDKAGEIMQELANSHLASTVSGAASELSFSRLREPDSATAKLQEIKDAQTKSAGGDKAVENLRKRVQAETNKMLLPKESTYWAKFLGDITC